jgi:colicin import membrane protein
VKPAGGPPDAHEKQRPPGRFPAVFLAVLVHAAFFALIVFGVTWQSRPQAPLQVELWDKLPPTPKAKAPEPEPPKPEPPKPEPPKPEPPKPEVKPEPPKPDPAIALKKERDKREKLEKLEREKAEKKKQEEAKKKREEEVKRREEERAKREAEKAREEAAVARRKEIDRYVDAIRAKIRGRANVPDTVVGSPEVQVLIRVLPGGEVLDATITKRSGNPTYDSSIDRGIRSASPLPVPPANSELFPQFRELNLIIRHER